MPHPLASRLAKAGITSTAWSYGVAAAAGYYKTYWETRTLIGVSQVGNTITFVSFTSANGIDHSLPVDQITYILAA